MDDLRELLLRAQAGCEESAAELYRSYSKHFRRAIRYRLSHTVRPLYGSSDVLQDFWGSLLSQQFAEEVTSSPQSLLAYLTKMAGNQALRANRHFLDCQKRDLRRQFPLDEVASEIDYRSSVSKSSLS